ncbi:hypothetical protein F4782DRAFT_503901 [Xylaria castorea]|nr:hypothetical protein F4782DRAFT_503901 [Xylaria castorea]
MLPAKTGYYASNNPCICPVMQMFALRLARVPILQLSSSKVCHDNTRVSRNTKRASRCSRHSILLRRLSLCYARRATRDPPLGTQYLHKQVVGSEILRTSCQAG